MGYLGNCISTLFTMIDYPIHNLSIPNVSPTQKKMIAHNTPFQNQINEYFIKF